MNDEPHPPLLPVLTGPTGVGKTGVSVAAAAGLPVEIVCADSMQIYRRMEAGTAKPSPEQRRLVPHHLVDFVEPGSDFTVADYRAAATSVIANVLAGGRLPFVVGGSRLYLKSLIAPFAAGPAPDPELRRGYAAQPAPVLHGRLADVDPATAARVKPADRKRITRALEVFDLTGETLAVLQQRSQAESPEIRARILALRRPREELYRRVEARVDAMLAAGLEEEVAGFLAEGLGPERISMQAHGYKEIMGYLAGRYDRGEAVRLLKRNTRRYVKYQLLWLQGEPGTEWIDADRPLAEVAAEVRGALLSLLPS